MWNTSRLIYSLRANDGQNDRREKILTLFEQYIKDRAEKSRQGKRSQLDVLLNWNDAGLKYDPGKLMDFAKIELGYEKKYFQGDDGSELKGHTLQVMQNFERYGFSQGLPVSKDVKILPLIRLALLFHDLGKRESLAGDGSTASQYQHTFRIIHEQMTRLRFSEREIDFVLGIVVGDPIGKFLKGQINTDLAKLQINNMSRRAGIPLKDFFTILTKYYIADASSYYALRLYFKKSLFGLGPMRIDPKIAPQYYQLRRELLRGSRKKLGARLASEGNHVTKKEAERMRVVGDAIRRLWGSQFEGKFEDLKSLIVKYQKIPGMGSFLARLANQNEKQIGEAATELIAADRILSRMRFWGDATFLGINVYHGTEAHRIELDAVLSISGSINEDYPDGVYIVQIKEGRGILKQTRVSYQILSSAIKKTGLKDIFHYVMVVVSNPEIESGAELESHNSDLRKIKDEAEVEHPIRSLFKQRMVVDPKNSSAPHADFADPPVLDPNNLNDVYLADLLRQGGFGEYSIALYSNRVLEVRPKVTEQVGPKRVRGPHKRIGLQAIDLTREYLVVTDVERNNATKKALENFLLYVFQFQKDRESSILNGRKAFKKYLEMHGPEKTRAWLLNPEEGYLLDLKSKEDLDRFLASGARLADELSFDPRGLPAIAATKRAQVETKTEIVLAALYLSWEQNRGLAVDGFPLQEIQAHKYLLPLVHFADSEIRVQNPEDGSLLFTIKVTPQLRYLGRAELQRIKEMDETARSQFSKKIRQSGEILQAVSLYQSREKSSREEFSLLIRELPSIETFRLSVDVADYEGLGLEDVYGQLKELIQEVAELNAKSGPNKLLLFIQWKRNGKAIERFGDIESSNIKADHTIDMGRATQKTLDRAKGEGHLVVLDEEPVAGEFQTFNYKDNIRRAIILALAKKYDEAAGALERLLHHKIKAQTPQERDDLVRHVQVVPPDAVIHFYDSNQLFVQALKALDPNLAEEYLRLRAIATAA